MNRLKQVLQGMDKQGFAPPEGLNDVISAIFPELKGKLSEKGSVKITIEGFKEQPVILEGVNEFILFNRTGMVGDFRSRASIRFRKQAINQIKESIIENL